jgi:hypothetical protein
LRGRKERKERKHNFLDNDFPLRLSLLARSLSFSMRLANSLSFSPLRPCFHPPALTVVRRESVVDPAVALRLDTRRQSWARNSGEAGLAFIEDEDEELEALKEEEPADASLTTRSAPVSAAASYHGDLSNALASASMTEAQIRALFTNTPVVPVRSSLHVEERPYVPPPPLVSPFAALAPLLSGIIVPQPGSSLTQCFTPPDRDHGSL